MKIIYSVFLVLAFITTNVIAEYHSQQIKVDQQRVHITLWGDKKNLALDAELEHLLTEKRTVILLSGPNDNWNSDTAWFARLAPKLADHYLTISIDRPGLVLAEASAQLGYIKFAKTLGKVIRKLKLERITFVAFASSNITVLQYLNDNLDNNVVEKVVLIDPDVLTPSAIQRYSKDAKPFKDNLDKYKTYIKQGKYNQRAQQKNQLDLDNLKLLAKSDPDTNWDYVNTLFAKGLRKII